MPPHNPIPPDISSLAVLPSLAYLVCLDKDSQEMHSAYSRLVSQLSLHQVSQLSLQMSLNSLFRCLSTLSSDVSQLSLHLSSQLSLHLS